MAQTTLEQLVESAAAVEATQSSLVQEAELFHVQEQELVLEEQLMEQVAVKPQTQVLGRRLLYSHHLIADSKRAAVLQWALELRLGGFSKIGWPGVIICEGDEADCQEYVQRLQRLRWKQLVVRGEQQVAITDGSSIDQERQLPWGFEEFGADKMSELASRCRDCGVEER